MFAMFALLLRNAKVLPLFAVGAESVAPMVADRWSPIINLGAIGCVLLWFLLRSEPRMKGIEAAIDRQSRAMLTMIIAMRGVPDYIKEQATAQIAEIDAHKK